MRTARSTSLSNEVVDVEQIIRTRTGDVLMKQTLLKADHFPGPPTAVFLRAAARDDVLDAPTLQVARTPSSFLL
jgi:hypothetical protein